MTVPQSLAEFAATVDRSEIQAEARQADEQRVRLAQLFPKERIATLPLEKYVVGLGERDTLCYEYEFGSRGMGSIRGGSVKKHLVYFSKVQNAMQSALKEEPDPQAAWLKLRAGLIASIELAEQGQWEKIDVIPVARFIPALRLKILHVLFPEAVLPIFSFTHLNHFLKQIGVAWKPEENEHAVAANRRLLGEIRTILPGWSTQEVGMLLYRWRPPIREGSIEDFASRFDRAALAGELAQAAAERDAFIAEFPMADFATMAMDRYVAPGAEPEGVIYSLEHKTAKLGEMGTRKRPSGDVDYLQDTGLYQKSLARAEDAQPLWELLRKAFADIFAAAAAGRWEEINSITLPNGIPDVKRAKLLHLYFPEEFLPIYNTSQITQYLEALELDAREDEGKWNPVRNRRILAYLRSLPELRDWKTLELAHLLKAWALPEFRAFKIAPGEDAKYWKDCQRDSVIAVGWGDVGDLMEFSSRDELKKAMVPMSYSKSSEKSGELWNFRNIQVGDRIVANRGTSQVLAIGRVVEPGYEYLEEPYGNDFNHILHVDWDVSQAREIPPQNRWAFVTVAELNAEQRRLIFDDRPVAKPMTDDPLPMLQPALNCILYGPPGTGKTYSVIRRAASIVDEKVHDEITAKKRYDELCAQGRIRLATFHQSFGYEDFIEGIRPEMDRSSGAAQFTVRDGVFKEIATDALFACLERVSRVDGSNSFEPRWNALIARISETGELEIPGLKDATWILSETTQGNLQAVNKETRKELSCGRSALAAVWSRLYPADNKLASMDVSKALGRGAHFGVIAAVYNYMQGLEPLTEAAKQTEALLPESASLVSDKPAIVQSYLELGEASGWRLRSDRVFPPFVLVIDEINRGNISRIFGELITLIEDDKRHCGENALTVTLPVSREPFTVPPNLWLLGTMNTADKSLALLDVALRRRFDFEEMPPDFSKCSELPEEMKEVLNRLNERLELRKDRDHRIGHAFFTRTKDVAGFNEVFRRKVVPLLQEFFFNDADGARYVLGEHDRTDAGGFLRPLPSTDPRWQRNRWRWFSDDEPGMDCWARLQFTLSGTQTSG